MQAAHPSSDNRPARPPDRRANGFTLVEVLVALAVFVAIMAIVIGAFQSVLQGWERGRRMVDGLHRGEYVMEQLVDALHSAMAYGAARQARAYSYEVDNNGGAQAPAGTLSWVTTSSALLPPRSWLEKVPHRLAISIEPQADGQPTLTVRAWPYLADTNTVDFTPIFRAPDVCGFACQVFNYEQQQWSDDWAASNALPAQVQLTLYIQVESNGPPLVLQRLVEIPLGVTNEQQNTRIDMFPPPASASGGGGRGSRGGRGGGDQGVGGRPGPGQGKNAPAAPPSSPAGTRDSLMRIRGR